MRLGGSGKGLVGVDITSATVKLIELKRAGGGLQVESYAVRPLREGAVVERRIRDMSEVVDALKRVIDHAKPSARRVAVTVPSNAVITKTLTLPSSLDDDEIEARIKVESDRHIPFPFNEVAFDFQRLGVNGRYAEQQDVLLIACRHQDVGQLTEAVTQAGLAPAVVDAEPFVIERAFTELSQQLPLTTGRSDGVALVDVGANMNSFYVLHSGRIVYSRNTALGGRALTEEICARYNLSLDEAGLAKKRGGLPEDYQHSVLEPFREALVQQTSRAQQLYYTSGSKYEVSRMVLAGGTSLLPGLAERLAEECGMDVVIADPFRRMQVNPRIDKQRLESDAPALLTACGLAMRGQV
ncbi:MAG TPA: type IV pilus assembly protein PilM [Halomonas sp.]|nr:type IV pilus assembly protein PilM [Halomonas sp.]